MLLPLLGMIFLGHLLLNSYLRTHLAQNLTNGGVLLRLRQITAQIEGELIPQWCKLVVRAMELD